MDEVTLGAIKQRSLSNERQIEEIKKELQDFRKEHADDMDKVHEEYKAVYELTTSVKVIAEQMGNMNSIVVDTNQKVEDIAAAQKKSENKMNERMTELENKPAKETHEAVKKIKSEIIMTIIGVVVGGAATAIITFLVQNM